MNDREQEVRQQAYLEVIATLIRGDGRLFGQRLGLSWLQGPPPGWSDDQLRALADQWAEDAQRAGRYGQWVTEVEARAIADRDAAAKSALALSGYFQVERDAEGRPVRLTPIPGRLEREGDSYVITEEQ